MKNSDRTYNSVKGKRRVYRYSDGKIKTTGSTRRGVQSIKSARSMTIGEIVEHRKNAGLSYGGRRSKLIQDVCDYCLEYCYVNRQLLSFRLKGRKFMCGHCRGSGDYDDVIKKDRPLPGWDSKYGSWRKFNK